jgi:hypothetical protein
VTVLHRLARLVTVLRSHRLTRARRIFATVFLEDLLSSRMFSHKLCRCTCSCWRCHDPAAATAKVCLQELKLSPPLSFHGIRAWYRLRVEQQAQEAKEAVRQQEVIISSPFVFATTPVSELFGRHRQRTSDRGAVFAKTKL